MNVLNWEITKKRAVNDSSTSVKRYKPTIYVDENAKKLEEKFKGEVFKEEVKFPKDLGEEHPFDFAETELLYKNFGFVTGVVDKYVDFIVGPGFFIKTDNDAAKQLIEKFMQDNNFDSLLRAWVKEALIKGTGFLEMSGKPEEEPTGYKILDAKWMFIKRDDLGVVEQINQIKLNKRNSSFSNFSLGDDVIDFKPFEVAVLSLNIVGDSIYGLGIVAPAMPKIDDIIGLSKDMHMLVHRKANAPIHVKLGNNEFMPQASDVTSFGEKLEVMHNKTEWATDWLVDMKVLNYGDVSKSFETPLKHDEDMLFFTFQIPEVLMGRGNIAEGLAEVQMDTFERRIQSLQAEIEKVVESQIFRRILLANGLDVHVEMEWGRPSSAERNERIAKITELMKNPFLDIRLRNLLEIEIVNLMGFDSKLLETPEEEREEEENTPVPIIPGQNKRTEKLDNTFTEEFYFGEVVSEVS